MNANKESLGFIGLGTMGFPMAHLLYQADYELTVFDSVPKKTDRFKTEHSNAVVVDDLEGFSDVRVVIAMLPDGCVVDAIVLGRPGNKGLIDILPVGASIIDMSSSQPISSREMARTLAQQSLNFLDAPVSGGVKRARDGSLAIMVGGDKAQFNQHYNLFELMGKVITYVGGPGAGHAMKALNNYVSAACLVATVEALLVGQAFGLEPHVMTDVLNSSTGRNNTTENKVKQFMLPGAFNSEFSLQLMTKDLGTAMNIGELLGFQMSLGQEVLRVWSEAARELEKSADHTEMYRYLQKVFGTASSLTSRLSGSQATAHKTPSKL